MLSGASTEEEKTMDTINAFLDAFPQDLLRAALKKRSLFLRGQRIENGWKIWTGSEPPGPPLGWMKVGSVIYYRKDGPPETSAPVSREKSRKTDTGVSTVDGLKCPECGAAMYKEGVCPGCEDGKKGYRIRLLCGECDKTILF